jgi:hypothetical protein
MANELVKQAVLNKARKDKFIIALTTPEVLKSTATNSERRAHHKSRQKVAPNSIQFSVYGAIVPEIQVPSNNLPYAGQNLKVSTHSRPEYGDITVKFTVDNQFDNYWYIWRWLDVLNDSKESYYDYTNTSATGALLPDELLTNYQTDFTIYGLNEFNKNTIQFTYTKAFPVNLGQIAYDYRDPGEMECEFTFSFSQMLVNLL